uniref:Uncharacterized protein n=1 Tax=Tanacetum cinerariifolium TaxID=118510 RepID=A0A6L2MIU5_TANCI|nr:hypothetical protein [Tanacetum cinerariifolium]
MYVYTSRLKQADINDLIVKYRILHDLHPCFPPPNDQMSDLPSNAIGVYHRIFDFSSVRIPFSTFLLAEGPKLKSKAHNLGRVIQKRIIINSIPHASSGAQSDADEVLENDLKQEDDARERHNQDMKHDDDDVVVEVMYVQPLRFIEASKGRDIVAQAIPLPTKDQTKDVPRDSSVGDLGNQGNLCSLMLILNS